MSVGMSKEFTTFDQQAVIKVCGIGGGGGNAVGRMIAAGLRDVEFIVINTDAQALGNSKASTRLQIGSELTSGLGSGAKPDMGRRAAEEDKDRITEVIDGADMVFVTAGLGGGTGTGATPVVAEAAGTTGALTVGIVTLPFSFEGEERMNNAIEGLKAVEEHLDALIVVPNDRLAELTQNTTFLNAFEQADEVLHNGVRAISEIITVPGLINVDFADVRTIMQERGRALMGIGTADGEQRAKTAAQEAIICPLLEQSDIEGAKGVIVNIKGGHDIGMREVLEAVTTVREAAHPQANIIFGAVLEDEERPELQVTVIAAGFPKAASEVFTTGIRAGDMNLRKLYDIAPPPPQLQPQKTAVGAETAASAKAEKKQPASAKAEPDDKKQKTAQENAKDDKAPAKALERKGEQLTFPQDEEVKQKPPEQGRRNKKPESTEDWGVPTFMRKRKRKQ